MTMKLNKNVVIYLPLRMYVLLLSSKNNIFACMFYKS